jgi:hypothetical protein
MKTPDDYLLRLRRQLKGFSPEEQEDLMAEIRSHIESGQNDPALGDAPDRRGERLMAELGSPEDLGKGFKSVHRPNRWLDFVLIFVPAYALIPGLLPLAYILLGRATPPSELSAPVLALSIRLAVILGLALCLAGFWRRSTLLLAFWIPDVVTRLFTQLLRENFTGEVSAYQPVHPLENWVWGLLWIAMLAWLARFLWINRQDALMLLFASLPLWQSIINLGAYEYARANGITLAPIYWNLFGISNLENLIGIASLAGFCLFSRRSLRWLSLLLGVAYFSFMAIARYWSVPVLAAWGSLLALLLIAAWLYDRRKRPAFRA